jgi:hypothetical protein
VSLLCNVNGSDIDDSGPSVVDEYRVDSLSKALEGVIDGVKDAGQSRLVTDLLRTSVCVSLFFDPPAYAVTICESQDSLSATS